jgi:hypothetical protein
VAGPALLESQIEALEPPQEALTLDTALPVAALDETIEDTFPASDPLSTIPNPHDEEALKRAREGSMPIEPEAPEPQRRR